MVAPGTTETEPLEAATNALKAGDVNEARSILRGLIARDPGNKAVWELVYQAAINDDERIHSLKEILKLDPGNPGALEKLAGLQPSAHPDDIPPDQTKSSIPSKKKAAKKRSPSMILLGGFVGIAGLACIVLWVAVLYRWGVIPLTLPADRTLTALAASHSDCQKLIDRALAASSDLCNRIGSDEACYGNNTVNARLIPGSAQQFSAPGDVIGVNQIESISASVLSPTLNEWGIAIFKVISNLPRSLPGETITLVVFGNTTLQNGGNLETYYFYSGLGKVACDQVPFDGLMVTMPEGTGIHFVVNGSELTLMGNASLKANQNGSMDVSLYSGSGSIAANGQEQVFTAGESVSVPLGGPNGTDPIGPPSTPQPISPDDLKVVCSMTGTYCDPAEITPVPSDLAAQWILTANAKTLTSTPIKSSTPSPTATPSPSVTGTGTTAYTPTATSTPTKTRTPMKTFTPTRFLATTPTKTFTPTRSLTRTTSPPPPPTLTASDTPTYTGTLPTSTPSFTPSDTATTVTGAVVVTFVKPFPNGQNISNNSETAFEVTAWDTAKGTTNGDGISHIEFWFTYAGGPIPPLPDSSSPQNQISVRYCAFTGAGACKTINGQYGGSAFGTLPFGTYTMYVQAWGTISGHSGVLTRTFNIIP